MAEILNECKFVGKVLEVVVHGGRTIGILLAINANHGAPVRIPVLLSDVPAEMAAELEKNAVAEIHGELMYDRKTRSHNIKARWVYLRQPAPEPQGAPAAA